ncbi:MAG: response regulator, partial [Proteobacteria bacterium]
SAKNGKEALKALKLATEPTLIFMDLMMPVMSGWELLDEIKKDESFSQHKIVTISAINPSQTLQDPTPLDTDGTIRKPLSWEQIWNEVTKHCNMPSSTT